MYETLDQPFPAVSKDLVERLEAEHPVRIPDINWSERKLWEYAGYCKAIAYLRSRLEEQLEDQITTSPNMKE